MPDKKEISIAYEKAPNRPVLAVTGAYGGVAPDGRAVVVHCYVEHTTVPASVNHPIRPDGSVDLTTEDAIRRADATREVVAILVLTPEAAIALGEFLTKQGGDALARRVTQ